MRGFALVIVLCWIAFWLYWIISAAGSKKNVRPVLKRFIGVRIVIFVIAAEFFLHANKKPYSFQNRIATKNEATLIFGLIIFLLGLSLAIWARLNLGKNWGMPMTKKQNPELVTSGPYRFIRHPIYTGIITAALASAIDVSVYWLIIFVIFATYFTYSAVVEERLMIKQFQKLTWHIWPKLKC